MYYGHGFETGETTEKSRITRIGAGAFKAKFLRLMEEVRRHRRAVVVTKRGQPVPDHEPSAIYGWLKGTVIIKGDIVEPTGGKWAALD